MLEILERFDNEGYEHITEAAGNSIAHITEAMDGGKAIGFIAYSYEADRTIVYDYDDGGDLMLCDGLVRSVMFKSVLKAIEVMEFRLPEKEKFTNLVRLKFLAEGENICENLDSFMNGCQNCKKNAEK